MASRFPLFLGFVAILGIPSLGAAQDPGALKTPPGGKLDRTGDPLPVGAVARLGTTRFRHLSNVRFVGHGGDGNTLLTLGGDNLLRFWDTHTGRELRSIPVLGSRLNQRPYPGRLMPSVLLSGDGKTLVVGANTASCAVFNVATGKMERELKIGGGKDERSLAATTPFLSRDGRVLAILGIDQRGGQGGQISVWNTATGKLMCELLPKAPAQPRRIDATDKVDGFVTAALSSDGTTLVVATIGRKGKDGGAVTTLRFTNAATGMEIKSFDSTLNQLGEVNFTIDGKGLLLRDREAEKVHLVNAASGKELRQFACPSGIIRGVLQAPDGKTLFVAGLSHASQYDLETGRERQKFPLGAGSGEDFLGEFSGGGLRFGGPGRFSMTISPDGKTFAVPAYAGVALWDVQTGKEREVVQGHRQGIESVAFAPGGKTVLTGAADSGLFLWDVEAGRRIREFSPKMANQEEDEEVLAEKMLSPYRVKGSFAPDGKQIAALWWGGKLHIFDTDSGKLRHHLGNAVGGAAFGFSPDGTSIALVGRDGCVRLWNMASGRLVRTLGSEPQPAADPDGAEPAIDQSIFSMAFAPDGRTLVLGEMNMNFEQFGLGVQVGVWELASGKERMRFRTHADVIHAAGGVAFESVASAIEGFAEFVFSPDGKLMAEAGFSNIKLRNLRTGKEIRSFGGRQVVGSTARFSPDGKLLLAGTHDGAIRLWDLATGSVLVDFPAHQGAVSALEFSPDGKRLASGARDTTVLIWDWEYIRTRASEQVPPKKSKLEPLWLDLAGPDASKAYQSIRALAGSPGDAVAFLKARVRPVPPVDAAHLVKLVDALEDQQFAVRQQAEQGLEKLGDVAAAAIQKRLAASPPLEMGRRLEALQKKLDAQAVSSEVLQTLRSIEALELIGSHEAREVLDILAKGAGGHRITEEAKRSLERLK